MWGLVKNQVNNEREKMIIRHVACKVIKYVDLYAAMNPSTIEDLEDRKLFFIFKQH